jgi:hypothetical protein
MKTILVGVALLGLTTGASAQYNSRNYGLGGGYGIGSNPNSNYVRPHVQRDGDYVPGHYRTNPNSTTLDNYSTKPNYNPYTGNFGTRRGSGW